MKRTAGLAMTCIVLLGCLAIGSAPASAATPTPIATPTMRAFYRAIIMEGWGAKSYTVWPMDLNIGSSLGTITQEGVSWWSTFMKIFAENGVVGIITFLVVILAVAWFILITIHRIAHKDTLAMARDQVGEHFRQEVRRLPHHYGRARSGVTRVHHSNTKRTKFGGR